MGDAVVLGYDDSPGAQAALGTAIELAQRFGGELVLAFGYDPPGAEGEGKPANQESVRELAEQFMEEALAAAREAGVEAEVALIQAPAAHEALLEAAATHDARFIVVGSHGESPLAGAILGATAHKLVEVADRPVVVVPAKE